MNELKVMRDTNGERHKLVLTVWSDDTQQVVARNVSIMELFGSEVEVAGTDELRGGRFSKWDSTVCEHTVEFKDKIVAPYQRRIGYYIEWVNENVEGHWCFGFRDQCVTVSSWGLLDFQLYLRFQFETVEDALLFKLRWI